MRPIIVLLCDPDTRKKLEARLRGAGLYKNGEIFDHLLAGDCSFGVDFSDDVLDDYYDYEKSELVERFGSVAPVAIEYSKVSCIRPLLQVVLSGLSGLVDTDFDELIEFEEVLARFSRDPDWDWAKSKAD
ncbi:MULTISPECIES: hypothetical protein [Amycolatopsis]|uniref:Uncharacterized protein n=1 Tax=Amycolatopsis albidoflavus TaxID=102226 RepID=A0ABW5I8K1_9PSEU